ncbi:hypothetical protein GQ600_10033 [Phytophthora cactorum]|nr:hypothetical protein GQ600_10033 [Phytophthora cactorum]
MDRARVPGCVSASTDAYEPVDETNNYSDLSKGTLQNEQFEAWVDAYIERRKMMLRQRPDTTIPIRVRSDIRMILMAVKPVLPLSCVFSSGFWKQTDEGAISKVYLAIK